MDGSRQNEQIKKLNDPQLLEVGRVVLEHYIRGLKISRKLRIIINTIMATNIILSKSSIGIGPEIRIEAR